MTAAFNQTISNAVSNLKDAGNPFMMLVMGATSDDGNSSVAFYKLDEIKDASYQSRNGCEMIHKAITQRLDATNPTIVYKTLQVCRILLLEGPEEFKKMMYQTTTRIQNIANMRKNNQDTFYSKDGIEAENMALAAKVYSAVVGDVMVLASYGQVDREVKQREHHSTSVGGAASMGYRSDFQLHQDREKKAFMKRMQEAKSKASMVVGQAQFERFDSGLPPSKFVDAALNNPKKKFAPEELNNFVEATYETTKIKEVCMALDKVLRDGKSSLVIRYKAIAFLEAMITEMNEALEYFKVHNLGIHRHLSIEQGDNPTKSALTQKIAQRAMDIVHGKVEVPASRPPVVVAAPVAAAPAEPEVTSPQPSYFTPAPKMQPPGGRRQMTEATTAVAATDESSWGGGGGWGDDSAGWGGSAAAPAATSSWGNETQQEQQSVDVSPQQYDPVSAPPPPPPTVTVPNPNDMMMQMQQQMMMLQKQMMQASAAPASPTTPSPASPGGEEIEEQQEEEEAPATCQNNDEDLSVDDGNRNEKGDAATTPMNDDGPPCSGDNEDDAATEAPPAEEGDQDDAEGEEVLDGTLDACNLQEEPQQDPVDEGEPPIDEEELQQQRQRSESVDVAAPPLGLTIDDPLVSSSTMMEVPNNSMAASPGSPSARYDMSMSNSMVAVPNNSMAFGSGNIPVQYQNVSMSGSMLSVPNNSMAGFGSLGISPSAQQDSTEELHIDTNTPSMYNEAEGQSSVASPASPAPSPLTCLAPVVPPSPPSQQPPTPTPQPSTTGPSSDSAQDQMMRQMQEFHRNMQMMMGMMMQQTIDRSAASTPAVAATTTFVDPTVGTNAAEVAAKQEAEAAQRMAQEAEEKAQRKARLTVDLRELLGQMRATQGMLDEQKQQLSLLKMKLQGLN